MTPSIGSSMLRTVLRRLASSVAWIVIAAPIVGCSGGTETGNPSFRFELSYTAYSSAPRVIGLRSEATEATVSNAWLDLDTVALDRAGNCGAASSDVVLAPALGIGDHASGNHNLTRVEVRQGAFCGLDLPFVRAHVDGIVDNVPAELAEHSIMLAGELSNGTKFSLLSSATPTVRLVADAGSFRLDEQHAHTLIAFDVATWLAGLDWSEASLRAGAIFVSAEENAALLRQFEGNLARGVALYRDQDGDGQLDAAPERLAHGE